MRITTLLSVALTLALGRGGASLASSAHLPNVATSSRMTPHSVRISVELTPSWTLGDDGVLLQIALNLGLNALHAVKGPQGEVLLSVDSAEFLAERFTGQLAELRAGVYAVLAVTDTGCGMDAATLARLGEPLFTTKPAGEGTGLDLSVVGTMVREHRGALRVSSVLGEVSSFRVFLPTTAARVPAP